MKLNRGMLLATAAVLVLGSVAVVGCSRSDDGDDDQSVGTEQAAAGATNEDATESASTNAGVEQYRGGARGGFAHGGRGFAHGGRGWGYGRGYGRGWGWGRGPAYGRRWWW